MTTRRRHSVAAPLADILFLPIRLAVMLFASVTPPDREVAKDFLMDPHGREVSGPNALRGANQITLDFANERLRNLGRSPVSSIDELRALERDESIGPIVVSWRSELKEILRRRDSNKLS
jgi:hypothetical protein